MIQNKPHDLSILVFRALIAGGGAPETELSINLAQYANTLSGMDSYCVRAFSEAMEVVPYTLAENAGLNPIATVTELRNKHAQGEKNAGINVRKVRNDVENITQITSSSCEGRVRCRDWDQQEIRSPHFRYLLFHERYLVPCLLGTTCWLFTSNVDYLLGNNHQHFG